MRFWNDELRICPKCRKPVSLNGEEKLECPHCQSRVWFFNFQPAIEPPEIPPPRDDHLLENPTTLLLLGGAVVFALVALVAIANGLVVSAASALAAIGFAAFGFLRHAEAKRIEDSLEHTSRIRNYGELMRDRVRELTSRYNSLLRTGNSRIEHYYNQIYIQAEQEKQTAEELRNDARLDRLAIRDVERRIYSMAERFIQDHLKWVSQKLRADPENYQRNKLQLNKSLDFVESVGYVLPDQLRQDALKNLKAEYREKLRIQALKDEQRRIKEQMREEARLRKEREQVIREAEQQERDLQQRLAAALRLKTDEHDAEIQELKRQIAEAEARSQRAKSMAELTKVGHIYVLSNIGSFGENIFKVGMTRRLEPELRVKELGDASVPFPFDVHAMFSCNDAPALERALHHELTRYRVNRINLRKEYFSVDLEVILQAVRNHHDAHVDYVAEPEALEYRESLQINPEDLILDMQELAEIGAVFEDEDDE